jgi:hypothetical protein
MFYPVRGFAPIGMLEYWARSEAFSAIMAFGLFLRTIDIANSGVPY